MIYTFYSYKGGVGRSMALANVAELFYEFGLKVIIVDWDLEAPGLERFFSINHTEVLEHSGLIDLLIEYKRRMTQSSDTAETEDAEVPFASLEPFLFTMYTYNRAGGTLQFLSAGNRSGGRLNDYAQLVRTFDWQDFYQNWEGELCDR